MHRLFRGEHSWAGGAEEGQRVPSPGTGGPRGLSPTLAQAAHG